MKFLIPIAFLFIITGCSHSNYTGYKTENIGLDSTYNSTELENIIAPYRDEVSSQMDSIIGFCDSTLIKYGPESPLGNFAADVVFEKGITLSPPIFKYMDKGNTIALLNFGGLRAPINQGPISIGNVFELMPFDNTITIVKIDAGGVVELIDYLYDQDGQPTSNAKFNLTADSKEMLVNDLTVKMHRTGIYVITSNYLASGGDRMNFLRDATQKWDSGILMRDVFIAHIKAKGTIYNKGIDGRMKISK